MKLKPGMVLRCIKQWRALQPDRLTGERVEPPHVGDIVLVGQPTNNRGCYLLMGLRHRSVLEWHENNVLTCFEKVKVDEVEETGNDGIS